MVAAGAVVGVVTPASADVTGLSSDAVSDFHPGETHQLKIHASGTGSGTVQLSGLTSDFDVTPATGCKQPPDSWRGCPACRISTLHRFTSPSAIAIRASWWKKECARSPPPPPPVFSTRRQRWWDSRATVQASPCS